jgi:hypothetical protein
MLFVEPVWLHITIDTLAVAVLFIPSDCIVFTTITMPCVHVLSGFDFVASATLEHPVF